MSYYDEDYINNESDDEDKDSDEDNFIPPSKPIKVKKIKTNNSDDEEDEDEDNDDSDDEEDEDDDDEENKNVYDEDDEKSLDDENENENDDVDAESDYINEENKINNNDTKNNKKITISRKNISTNKKKIINDEDSDDEDSDDDDSDDDKNYLQKFNEGLSKNYILDNHPECIVHNYNEVLSMCQVMRDANGIIIDDLHMSIPQLTKYERARILGLRAKQINSGATPFVKVPEGIIDGYVIAQMELKEKKIPFIIRRPMPNGGSEYWYLKDLEDILF